MPDKATSFEMGSNLAVHLGLVGMSELQARIEKLRNGLGYEDWKSCLMEGAELYRAALEHATPTGTKYKAPGSNVWAVDPHPGQAKRHTIVYERKGSKGQLATTAPSLLIGYEKKHGYYMYWFEAGTHKQPARPFARSLFDSMADDIVASIAARAEALIMKVAA